MIAWPDIHPFERELTGDTMTIGTCTIQPIARITGKSLVPRDGAASFAWLRLVPVAVVVRENDREYRVPIINGTAAALRGIVVVALAVAAICAMIIALQRWYSSHAEVRAATRE